MGELTWNISPTTKIMAMHATMSAWFWITNSWLNNGGFLLEVRRFAAIVREEATTSSLIHQQLL